MSCLMDAIYLDSATAQYSVTGPSDDGNRILSPLGKINIFVGANNVGKSRLLRTLAASTNQRIVPRWKVGEQLPFKDVAAAIRSFGRKYLQLLDQFDAKDGFGQRQQAEFLSKFNSVTEIAGEDISPIKQIASFIKEQSKLQRDFEMDSRGLQLFSDLSSAAQETINSISPTEDFNRLFAARTECKRLYIPTLRTLRSLQGASSPDIFGTTTKEAFFKDAGNVSVFSGLTLYDRVMNLLLGDHAARENIRAFEQFISEDFFGGEPITLVPKPSGLTELTVKVGNETEHLVSKLGDGIQSILILTFPLFEHGDRPLLAFIEEPELFMHPWLQRVYLKTLRNRFPSHQYFLTTHSNHFLDLTLDIDDVSVFTLEKELQGNDLKQQTASFQITNVSHGHRGTLELLGVRNSSVFLSNCTIWVEGITDRKYIAHWLKLYQEHLEKENGLKAPKFFKEDLHYSFVEYSGSNLVHWSFLDESGPDVDRLCGKLFLVADSDNASAESAKGQRHQELAKKLGDRFHKLKAKEIENLLTPQTLKKVLLSFGEDESNLKFAGISHSMYLSEALGTFIDTSLFVNSDAKKRRGGYAQKTSPNKGISGSTISAKPVFCAKAVEAMVSWNDVSEEAQTLTMQLFRFIQNLNESQ